MESNISMHFRNFTLALHLSEIEKVNPSPNFRDKQGGRELLQLPVIGSQWEVSFPNISSSPSFVIRAVVPLLQAAYTICWPSTFVIFLGFTAFG